MESHCELADGGSDDADDFDVDVDGVGGGCIPSFISASSATHSTFISLFLPGLPNRRRARRRARLPPGARGRTH